MKCVMVMFDSLNRRCLPPYAPDTWVQAPNFKRLAERTATFDTSYVCSMPCMPARRDFHTARPNFLHCGWGPIEPFDDSVPQMLTQAGVTTHLATDHYHYFEDGGATYHNRYGSWECFRGHEGDPFVGQCREPHIPENANGKGRRSDWVNREHIVDEADYPQTQCFAAGLDFIERNADDGNWFLQLETFDPHEPFTTHRQWTDRYGGIDDPALCDWPGYGVDDRNDAHADQIRKRYAALLSKCDAHLGDVLDAFDRHDLWQDTMLVVWTDHGYLLGERDRLWAKNVMPLFDEVARTPLFIHDPRTPDADGARRSALVQPAIDLGPTLLNFFGLEPTDRMLGRDLADTVASDATVRDAGLFGYHGNRVNLVTDTHVYLKRPANQGPDTAHHYTLMPTSMRGYKVNLDHATLNPPFSFTRGMPTLKLPTRGHSSDAGGHDDSLLFNNVDDPQQQRPLDDAELIATLDGKMAELMAACDAPAEQYERMGLSQPA